MSSADHLTRRQRDIVRRLAIRPAFRYARLWRFPGDGAAISANTASVLFAFGLVRQRISQRSTPMMVLTEKGRALAEADKPRDQTPPRENLYWLKDSA